MARGWLVFLSLVLVVFAVLYGIFLWSAEAFVKVVLFGICGLFLLVILAGLNGKGKRY
jgi:hypothetical protein